MKIEGCFETEQYWMVSRVAIVEEYYFDDEQEAREFAKTRPGCVVEAPVVKEKA